MAGPLVSLVMIVRDEEANLARCLDSVQGVADEIVIVDTGSRDRTREVARAYTPLLFDYEWRQDFAAARNFARDQARGHWILRLDADEALAPGAPEAVARLAQPWVEGEVLHAYFGLYTHFTDPACSPLLARLDFGQIALFPNHPAFRFQQANYDYLDYTGPLGGAVVQQAPELVIYDYGSADAARQERRHRQNIEINRQQLERDPGNDYLRFHMCRELHLLGEHQEAMLQAYTVLNRRPASPLLHPHHLVMAAYYGAFAALQLGQLAAAVDLARLGLEQYPHHYGLWTVLAGVYLAEEVGHTEAAPRLRDLLPDLAAPPLASPWLGMLPGSWGPWFLRGTAHLLKQEPASALPYFLQTQLRFPDSVMHLTCVLETAGLSGRWDIVRELLARAPAAMPQHRDRIEQLREWARLSAPGPDSSPQALQSLLLAARQWREQWPPG